MSGTAGLLHSDHLVHFYCDDVSLLAGITDRLVPPVRAGGAGLVIATPEHRACLLTALTDAGVDVTAQQQAGALTWLDAAELADQLLVDGRLDPVRFEAVVADPVRRLAAARGQVLHVYGEIVAVLWAGGHVVAAIELEQLWNGLLAEVPIILLCGYPAQLPTPAGGADEDVVAAFGRVCAAHTSLVGGAPVPDAAAGDVDATAARRFPATLTAPGHARRFVADTLRDWFLDELTDAATLVVAELAGNAVEHAMSDFTTTLARHGDGVRITVGDQASTPPRRATGAVTDLRGRGLLLVDAVSTGWGHTAAPGGKLVWADLSPESIRPRWAS